MDFAEMLENYRAAVVSDFEKKLGRLLTDEEREDIARIRSGMMLERFDVRITHARNAAEVEAALREAREVGLMYPADDGPDEKG
jgi:hypothetical protein